MNRFFVKKENVENNKIYINNEEDVHHILKVLRLRIGEMVEISDGEKFEYICRLDIISKDKVEGTIIKKQEQEGEPPKKIYLFQGIPKQGKLEGIVQRAVELGVFEVIPVYMKRSVVAKSDNESKKIERLKSVSLSAAKQSKRGIIPNVVMPLKFKEAVERLKEMDSIVFPYEEEREKTIKDLISRNESLGEKIGVIVGPEGGFSQEEANEIVSVGGTPITLGKRILRTETASLNVLSILIYEMDME